jgi:hypothetical protein
MSGTLPPQLSELRKLESMFSASATPFVIIKISKRDAVVN